LAAFALLVAAVATPGLAAAGVVAAVVALAALASLWGHIRRTNFEISRFVEALRFDDLVRVLAAGTVLLPAEEQPHRDGHHEQRGQHEHGGDNGHNDPRYRYHGRRESSRRRVTGSASESRCVGGRR
jgi:hypothetical protein